MIIKGKSRAGPAGLAAHLGNAEKNERVQLLETKGTVADDLRGALVEMDAYAAGTRCQKSLYHAALSPEPPHRLTPEQRLEAVAALEEKLGLAGHARVVVLHEKLGREHLHVVWSRIDLGKMRTVSDSHNYRRHEEVARDLERRFGHDRVQGAHHERANDLGEKVERPDRSPSRPELRQEEKTGIKGRQVKEEITTAFRASDGAAAFVTALEDKGYILAQGDRRDFVILDPAGGTHSLARRIDGVKAAELRAFMAPLDRESFPSVEEARAVQAERTKAAEVERVKAEQIEAERRRVERHEAELQRQKREALTRDGIAASYARSDGYVTQSQAAQRDFIVRQARLDKNAARDGTWQRIEAGEAQRRAESRTQTDGGHTHRDAGKPNEPKHDAPTPNPAKIEEPFRRSPEAERPSPYAPSRSAGANRPETVEMTDRMARLLGRMDGSPRDRDPSDDRPPDRQREAPGGGRTRSR